MFYMEDGKNVSKNLPQEPVASEYLSILLYNTGLLYKNIFTIYNTSKGYRPRSTRVSLKILVL